MHQYFLLLALTCIARAHRADGGSEFHCSIGSGKSASYPMRGSGCVTRVKTIALFFWLSDGDCLLTTNSYLCMSPSAPYPPPPSSSLYCIMMSTSLRHRERERDCFLLERSMLLVLNIIGHITVSALLLIFSTSWAGQQNKVEPLHHSPCHRGILLPRLLLHN